jgi:hypothetical protein
VFSFGAATEAELMADVEQHRAVADVIAAATSRLRAGWR